MGDVLSAALTYASRGWHVFPTRGKEPATPRWSQDSTTDEQQIVAWFAGSQGLGVAIDLGKSKLAVVDVDHPEHLDLDVAHLEGAWTYRGQVHRKSWLFAVDGVPVPQAKHAWGEVKSAGGYVVMPPSPHPLGRTYEWLDQSAPEPPMTSAELRAAIAPRRKETVIPAWDGSAADPGQIAEARKRLDDGAARVAAAMPGERNKILNDVSMYVGHLAPHYLAPQHVASALEAAAHTCGLVADSGLEAARATIKSGLAAGMKSPVQMLSAPLLDLGEALIKESEESASASDAADPTVNVNDNVKGDTPFDPVILVRGDTVPVTQTQWLWPGRLPLGHLVMLDGDPGVGKSTLAVTLAAHVTAGKRWPDGSSCPRGSVLMLSAEDDESSTVIPRLLAAGGDPSRFYFLDGFRVPTADGKVIEVDADLGQVGLIRRAVAQTGAKLVLVDVLAAHMPSGIDSHRDSDVRKMLRPLFKMAQKAGCTVIFIRHMGKARGGGVALYAGTGSVGIGASGRVVTLVAADPADPTVAVWAWGKINIAALPDGLAYKLVPAGDVARVEWQGLSGRSADDLVSGKGGSDKEPDEKDDAAMHLAKIIADNGGQIGANEAKKALRAGYGPMSSEKLGDVRKKAHVKVRKSSEGPWIWYLDGGTTDPEPEGAVVIPFPGVDTADDEEDEGIVAGQGEESKNQRIAGPSTSDSSIVRFLPEEAGPCVRCGTSCHRYGDGGGPLCDTCQGA